MVLVCLTSAKTGEFFTIKINEMELSTGKILEENLLHSLLYTGHWEINSTSRRTITKSTRPNLHQSYLPRRQ
jgi:hypothetical protein